MGHRFRTGGIRSVHKKRRVIVALLVGVVLLVILVVVGVMLVVVIKALFDQADTGIGQSIGNLVTSLWNYATDFVNALWKQVISNPLQLITGGKN